tara:strand:+ start:164 stop:400 length:237 start_codon:yes stop_codon:yes gene_type:complete
MTADKSIQDQADKVMQFRSWTSYSLEELASFGRLGPDAENLRGWADNALGAVESIDRLDERNAVVEELVTRVKKLNDQ